MSKTLVILRSFGPAFALLFALQFISMGAMEMSGPFWPLRIDELSPSGDIFALAGIGVYVCPMLGISLTSTFWGRIGDRYGNRLMMIRALLGLAITQFLISFSQDVWLILFLRFLQGAFAGYIAPAQAYGIQMTGGRNRGVLLAWLQVATNVGSLGGAFLGGMILDTSSFATINQTAGIICIVCAVFAWWFLPALQAGGVFSDQSGVAPARTSLQIPVGGLLLLMGIMLAARMTLQVPFSLYMLDMFQAPHWLIGLCYGLLALGFMVAAPLWAALFNGRTVGFTLAWMVAISAGCALLATFAGLTRSQLTFSILYLLWGGLLGGTTPVLVSLVSAATASNRQGTALGLTQSCQQVASVAGIAVGALVSQEYGLRIAYPLVSLIYAAALITSVGIWLSLRSQHPSGEPL